MPPWLDVERSLINVSELSQLLYIEKSSKTQNYFINFATIYTSMIAWWEANKTLEYKYILRKRIPIWNNPMFLINNKPFLFPIWKENGISNVGQIIQGGKFMT